MKHVLFVVSSAGVIGPNKRKTGYFMSEVSHPFFEFEKNGFAVHFASPAGGTPPMDGYDEKDAKDVEFKSSPAWARLNSSQKLSEVDIAGYDAVFFPGGLGPMVDLADNAQARQLVRSAWESSRVVGAVCHGPVALLGVTLSDGKRLIEGKRLASFTDEEEKGYAQKDVPFLLQSALKQQGAISVEVAPWQPNTVVDGRLVTGQNPASAAGVARAMMAAMLNP
ncbi:MAG: type 1 glutamine amidotransferase domain-containing protein [Myxococcaceae bacterium]|nr:type 1 glutamine amidotransferase domain-containing protein [Myxococcaceae bacterium]